MLKVNEIFSSIQGEGYWAGHYATFVRLQGCTVGCEWCDTKYTWEKGGVEMSPAKVVGKILDGGSRFVIITGGEPLMQDLDELLFMLPPAMGYYVQLETSGVFKFIGNIRPNWVTCSPKPRAKFYIDKSVADRIDELKFVVDDDLTLEQVTATAKSLGPRVRISLMPEGTPPTDAHIHKTLDMVKWLATRPNQAYTVRYSDRLQTRLGVK